VARRGAQQARSGHRRPAARTVGRRPENAPCGAAARRDATHPAACLERSMTRKVKRVGEERGCKCRRGGTASSAAVLASARACGVRLGCLGPHCCPLLPSLPPACARACPAGSGRPARAAAMATLRSVAAAVSLFLALSCGLSRQSLARMPRTSQAAMTRLETTANGTRCASSARCVLRCAWRRARRTMNSTGSDRAPAPPALLCRQPRAHGTSWRRTRPTEACS
jgi:hypothetical protein